MRVSGRWLIASAATLVAVASGLGCAGGQAGAAAKSVTAPASGPGTAGRPAPEIVVELLDGRSLRLASLRGQVVLLDVWATWCVPCLKELPMLDGMARRLRGKGVEIVAVSVDQERANVIKFLASQPQWGLTVAHDPAGAIADSLQPEKMPTSYAIDRNGIIRYVNEGFEPADAPGIEQKLAELAAQPAAGGGGKPGAVAP